MRLEEVPVLIVGGGVVGLSAALFLRSVGVDCLLLERHPTTSIHPRARGVNGRTMELMRELGLETVIRSTGAQLAPAIGIHSAASLRELIERQGEGGWFLRRMRRRGMSGQSTRKSPSGPCRCTQDLLEPLLLSAARGRGAEARLFHELESVVQDERGVTGVVLDRASSERYQVRARFVIAADGARSRMRERVGFTRSQLAAGGHQMNLYFAADLRSLVTGREFSLCVIEQPGLHGLFASINNADLWVLHVSYDPERGESPSDFTPERCVDLIRRASGIPDLAVELKGVLPWESSAWLADSYRRGRVFIAGDAAHSMPPWGGFGANTGIQDVHNLAWKLAAVLSGRAGEALLDTYEAERRPVGRAVCEISASMNDARGLIAVRRSPLATIWGMRKLFPYLGVGYGYSSTAIALESGATPGPGSKDLKGRPGTRVPHVWLTRRSGHSPPSASAADGLSSLDLVGRGHVLLTGPRDLHWRAAARELASRSGLPIDVVQLGSDVEAVKRGGLRVFGIGEVGALLVRPDGFVAFRSRSAPRSVQSAGDVLEAVFGRTLARDDSSEPAAMTGELTTFA
jgi:putative polyketide hydroxylase